MIALLVVLAAVLGGPIGTLTVAGRGFVVSWVDVAAAVVALAGLGVAWRRRRVLLDPAVAVYALLLAVFLLQVATGGDRLEILGGSTRFLTAAAVLVGLGQLLPSGPPTDDRAEQVLGGFGLVLAVLVVVDLGVGLADPARTTFYAVKNGIVTPLGASNYLAGFLAVVAVLLAARAWSGARSLWWLAGASAVGAAATLSRGAAVAVAAGLLVAAVGRARPRVGLRLAALVAVATLGGSLLLGAVGSARVEEFVGSTGDSRLLLLGVAWDGFVEAPVLGVGLNNITTITAPLPQPHDNAHNLLLHALAETGLVGAAVYLGLWALLARRLWRATDDPRRVGLAAAATTLFVHAAIEALAHTRAVEVLLAILLVLAARLPGARAIRAVAVGSTSGSAAGGSTLRRTSQGSTA